MSKFREPWDRDSEPVNRNNTLFIYNNIGVIVAEVFSYKDLDEMNKLFENAERIVACINACAGITNEALEKGLISCAVENLAQNLPYDNGNFYFDDVKVWEDV